MQHGEVHGALGDARHRPPRRFICTLTFADTSSPPLIGIPTSSPRRRAVCCSTRRIVLSHPACASFDIACDQSDQLFARDSHDPVVVVIEYCTRFLLAQGLPLLCLLRMQCHRPWSSSPLHLSYCRPRPRHRLCVVVPCVYGLPQAIRVLHRCRRNHYAKLAGLLG